MKAKHPGTGNPGRGGAQPGAGQPKAKIDLDELEKLCVLQCTQGEIAAYFGVTRRTIENRAQEPEFREIMERGQQKGLISLRRKQMQAVELGNTTMLIWMGKQLLGQKDKQEFSGPGGGPIEVSLSDARERVLSRIAQMSEPGPAPKGSGGAD